MHPRATLLATALCLAACGRGVGSGTDGQPGTTTAATTTDVSTGSTGAPADPTTGDGPTTGTGTTADATGETTAVTTDPPATTGPACEPLVATDELGTLPLDFVLYLDTEADMGGLVIELEKEIGGSLLKTLEDAGLDFKIIVLASYPKVCFPPPLAGAPCEPLPPLPATVAGRYYFYHHTMASAELPAKAFTSTFAEPDAKGSSPDGWSAWLRDDSHKVLLAISDGADTPNVEEDAVAADAAILALSPEKFGTVDARRYVFHTVAGFDQHNPPYLPYVPGEPHDDGECYADDPGPALTSQALSTLTGGVRFSMCSYAFLPELLTGIAERAVEATRVCSRRVPTDGAPFVADDLQVTYLPGDPQAPPQALHRVSANLCDDAGYTTAVDPDDDAWVHLCPAACAKLHADVGSRLELRYGCPGDPG